MSGTWDSVTIRDDTQPVNKSDVEGIVVGHFNDDDGDGV